MKMKNIQWFIFALFLKSVTPKEITCDVLCTCTKKGNKYAVTCNNNKQLHAVPNWLSPDTIEIFLENNSISEIRKDDFKKFPKLKLLSLSGNVIEKIYPTAFQHLFALETLLLDRNKLVHIKNGFFQHLSSIKKINLTENNIKHVDKFAFATIPLDDAKVLMGKMSYCRCVLGYSAYYVLTPPFMHYPSIGCTAWPSPFRFNGTVPCADANDTINELCKCLFCWQEETYGSCLETSQSKNCSVKETLKACTYKVHYDVNKKIHVTANSMKYKKCLKLEESNKVTCVRKENKPMVCYFCCLGHRCNLELMAALTFDETFYVKLGFKADQHIKDYITFKSEVENIMKHVFQKVEGGYNVEFLSISYDLQEAYLKIHTTNLNTYNASMVKIIITQSIKNSVDSTQLKAHHLNTDLLKITTKKFVFCEANVHKHGNRLYYWPKSLSGTTVKLKCVMVNNSIDKDIEKVAKRLCTTNTAGHTTWEEPNYSICSQYKIKISNALKTLEENITPENQIITSVKMKAFLNLIPEDFKSEDISSTLNILEGLLKIPGNNRSEQTTRNAISSISSMIGLQLHVLQESNHKHGAYSRLRQVIQTISYTTSLEKGDFKFADKNLAVAIHKVNIKKFAGCALSSTDTSAHYKMKMYPTSHISVSRKDISTTIILPDSLLKSLGEQTTAIERVAFNLYATDTLFVVCFGYNRHQIVQIALNLHFMALLWNIFILVRLIWCQRVWKQQEKEPIFKKKRSYKTQVNSKVITAGIPDIKTDNLKDPIFLSFSHIQKDNSTNPRCVYWHKEPGKEVWKWSSKGCSLKKTNDGSFTTCTCNHLTNFALIMDIYSGTIEFSEADERALSAISYIGCGASLLALIFTIATYIRFKKLRGDRPSKILVNLCIALAITNLIFVTGMQDYTFENHSACVVVAVFMHYFLLSALTWMAIEALNMYLSLVVVFGTEIEHFIIKCSIFGWGLPLIIVILTIAINHPNNYGLFNSSICWITNPAFYVSFLAPVGLILLMNCIAFGLVIREIFGTKMLKTSSSANIATRLRGAVVIIILLGLTYLFAFFAINQASIVFYYLFAIFNSLQGVFIFIFYVILKKDALNAWKSLLYFQRPDIDDDSFYSRATHTPSSGFTASTDI